VVVERELEREPERELERKGILEVERCMIAAVLDRFFLVWSVL